MDATVRVSIDLEPEQCDEIVKQSLISLLSDNFYLEADDRRALLKTLLFYSPSSEWAELERKYD